jgi:phospholipid/cholesterol/gamma-HCH transport system substrate-binding protein
MRFRIRFADKIVGIFILLAILGVAAALILLGLNQRWFARNYAYWSRFASAEGLSAGMPIKLKGFEIGRVDEIRLGRDNLVEMEFHVYDTYHDKVMPGSVLEKASSPSVWAPACCCTPAPARPRRSRSFPSSPLPTRRRGAACY